MTTPVYDFVQQYLRSGTARLHMPGHKGQAFLGCEAMDITEICGADSLYEADGILAASEANAAQLFGAVKTFYSTEGSSQCIRAMLFLAGQWAAKRKKTSPARPLILAARNAHKAFLYACALLDYDVEWLYPDVTAQNSAASLCSCPIAPESLRIKLSELSAMAQKPIAVYLTSPDYLGGIADIGSLSAVCHSFDLPLLVDNAHGAYLHFLPKPCHPLDLGADLCCDSAHKTLPVLTGGAYLHLGQAAADAVGKYGREALAMFGSTSPSYLILQSLDLCNRYLAGSFPAELAKTVQKSDALKAELSAAKIPFLPGEPLKLTLAPWKIGMTGTQLAELLRQNGMEPEFANADNLVCMFTPQNPDADYTRLRAVLLALPHGKPLSPAAVLATPLPHAMSLRDALFAAHETLPLAAAEGRICGAPAVSCPPAIAIAACGEVLTKAALLNFAKSGMDTVCVVKE